MRSWRALGRVAPAPVCAQVGRPGAGWLQRVRGHAVSAQVAEAMSSHHGRPFCWVLPAPRRPSRVVAPRTRSCCTASLCASSCRRPARSCPTRCTSTMPPAGSLPVSPRKSPLPEKVQPPPHPTPGWPRFVTPPLTPSSLSALATLKPQAGLIVPQAVPSSQPSVVVSAVGPRPPPLPFPACTWHPGLPHLHVFPAGSRRADGAGRAGGNDARDYPEGRCAGGGRGGGARFSVEAV